MLTVIQYSPSAEVMYAVMIRRTASGIITFTIMIVILEVFSHYFLLPPLAPALLRCSLNSSVLYMLWIYDGKNRIVTIFRILLAND